MSRITDPASDAINGRRTLFGRRGGLVASAAGLVLAASILGGAVPASAATASSTGYPGMVSIGQGPYVGLSAANDGSLIDYVVVQGAVVGKSPAYRSYSQYVCRTSRLYVWSRAT